MKEIFNLLNGIQGFANKVVYYAWEEGQSPSLPFICYFSPDVNNFSADGKVYFSTDNFIVELYSKKLDRQSEEKIETALSSFYFTKERTYLNDEKCYMTIYRLEK